MKRYVKRFLSIVCAMVLLVGSLSMGGTVIAETGGYPNSWWVFPPKEMTSGPITIKPAAGKTISTSYADCGVQLPDDVDFEYLSLYVKITLNQAAADTMNKGGTFELANVRMDASELHWPLTSVTWKEGLNEFYFPFRSAGQSPGNSGPFDMTKPINWFRLYTNPGTAVLEAEGLVTYHEISIVDTTEGGLTFGKTDTYLQASRPFTSAPNTLEVSVKVAEDAALTDAAYPILFAADETDMPAIALSMTADGALSATWGTKRMTVACDLRTGVWTDIALVRDAAADRFVVYIDGVQTAVFSGAGEAVLPATALCVGSNGVGATFQGGIADVRVWSDARTAAEIQNNRVAKVGNRKNNLAADAQGLLANWYLLGSIDYVLDVQEDGSVNENHLCYAGSRADDWDVNYEIPTDTIGEDYYTMVFIPDTQEVSTGGFTEEWMASAQWIADNVEKENIVHVFGAGDTTWTDAVGQWNTIKAGFDLFTDKVSWSNATGNHDYPGSCTSVDNPDYIIRNSSNYNDMFGIDYIQSTAAKNTYCGSFVDDYDIYGTAPTADGKYVGVENSYYRFTVNGVQWMVLQLEYHPRVSAIRWACDILEQYPDDNVIFITHAYIGEDNGRYSGHWMPYTKSDAEIGGYIGELMPNGAAAWPGGTEQPIWTEILYKHDNVKLLLCGHDGTTDGHVLTRLDENEAGNTVPQVMINAQDLDVSYFEGEALAMLGLLRFSADGTKVDIQYYSAYHDASYHPSNQEMRSLTLTTKACEHPTTETREQTDATCTEEGRTAGVFCTKCNWYVEGGEVIPAHKTEQRDELPATVLTEGITAGVYCTVCNKYLSGGLVIPRLSFGDVNGDRNVDSTDARVTLQYAVGKVKADALDTIAADVNGDGKVDSTDARLILQYAVGKIREFPQAK